MVGARTPTPRQVQGSGSVGGKLCAPGRRTGFLRKPPHTDGVQHQGSGRVIPTSASIWAHTPHPDEESGAGSSWEALCPPSTLEAKRNDQDRGLGLSPLP